MHVCIVLLLNCSSLLRSFLRSLIWPSNLLFHQGSLTFLCPAGLTPNLSVTTTAPVYAKFFVWVMSLLIILPNTLSEILVSSMSRFLCTNRDAGNLCRSELSAICLSLIAICFSSSMAPWPLNQSSFTSSTITSVSSTFGNCSHISDMLSVVGTSVLGLRLAHLLISSSSKLVSQWFLGMARSWSAMFSYFEHASFIPRIYHSLSVSSSFWYTSEITIQSWPTLSCTLHLRLPWLPFLPTIGAVVLNAGSQLAIFKCPHNHNLKCAICF